LRIIHEGQPCPAAPGLVQDCGQDDYLLLPALEFVDGIGSKAAGGRLDFRVPFIGMKLGIGGKVTKKDTHTIDITLVPPEDRDTRQVRDGETEEVLVNAITTIRDVMAKAAQRCRAAES
jgi:hypothetical protein